MAFLDMGAVVSGPKLTTQHKLAACRLRPRTRSAATAHVRRRSIMHYGIGGPLAGCAERGGGGGGAAAGQKARATKGMFVFRQFRIPIASLCT